jgi:hypothetical protein
VPGCEFGIILNFDIKMLEIQDGKKTLLRLRPELVFNLVEAYGRLRYYNSLPPTYIIWEM